MRWRVRRGACHWAAHRVDPLAPQMTCITRFGTRISTDATLARHSQRATLSAASFDTIGTVRRRQHHQGPVAARRRIRLLLALPPAATKVPAVVLASAVARRRQGHRATSPTSSPPTAISRPRPTCSGARSRVRWARRPARRSAPAAAAEDRGRRSRHDGQLAHSASCRSSTAAPRRSALLRRPLRDPGPKRLGYDAGVSCHGTRMLDYSASSTA